MPTISQKDIAWRETRHTENQSDHTLVHPGDDLERDRRQLRRGVESCTCATCFISCTMVSHAVVETDIVCVCPACVEKLEDTGEKCAVETASNLEVFLGGHICYAT